MSDLIDRQDAIDAINAYLGLSAVSRTIQNMTSIQEILENLPSAELGRKKGKWLVHGDIPKTCSCCHEDWDKYVNGDVWYSDELPNFCPNCGSYNGGKNEV